jgi:hypothetical protein
MKTIPLDVRPGSLKSSKGSPFEVPISQWKTINDYLGSVAATDIPPNAVSALPAFTTLKASAVKWKSTTLPNLINLSQGIYNYGANTVVNQFPRLKQLLQTMQSNIPANSAADFHNIMSTILTAAEQNTALATTIANEFATIDTSVQASKAQIQNYLASVSPPQPPQLEPRHASRAGEHGPEAVYGYRPHSYFEFQMYQLWQLSCAPPQSEIERVRGAWSSISDDLNNFQSTVNDEIASSSPFLADLNLDVAVSEWRDLASEARQFSENLSSL